MKKLKILTREMLLSQHLAVVREIGRYIGVRAPAGKKKEELISKFYMLDDEDKKDVKDNIDKYSLDDIESKLSVICVRKRVSFANEVEEDQPATTFSLEGLDAEDDTPEWIKAVLDYKNNK